MVEDRSPAFFLAVIPPCLCTSFVENFPPLNSLNCLDTLVKINWLKVFISVLLILFHWSIDLLSILVPLPHWLEYCSFVGSFVKRKCEFSMFVILQACFGYSGYLVFFHTKSTVGLSISVSSGWGFDRDKIIFQQYFVVFSFWVLGVFSNVFKCSFWCYCKWNYFLHFQIVHCFYRNAVGFCIFNISGLLYSSSCFVDSLGFYIHKIMLSANRDSLISSFIVRMSFISFSCLNCSTSYL